MINEEKVVAVELRVKGMSIKAIASEINAAQSSVSLWVRDVVLTDSQKQSLRANTHSLEVIEKRRQARLKSELKKRNASIEAAKEQIHSIDRRELRLIGIGLYWAEGAKKQIISLISQVKAKGTAYQMGYAMCTFTITLLH